jgi:hypothetical protein
MDQPDRPVRVETSRGYTLVMPWQGRNARLLRRQVRTPFGYTEAFPGADGTCIAAAVPALQAEPAA